MIENGQTDGFCRGSILESRDCKVLHRPFEPAGLTGEVDFWEWPLIRLTRRNTSGPIALSFFGRDILALHKLCGGLYFS